MSFFLTALLLALGVGILRAVSLTAKRPAPRARATTPQASSGRAGAVRERRAA